MEKDTEQFLAVTADAAQTLMKRYGMLPPIAGDGAKTEAQPPGSAIMPGGKVDYSLMTLEELKSAPLNGPDEDREDRVNEILRRYSQMPLTPRKREELDAAADEAYRQAEANPGVDIPVDWELAAYMGAFVDKAMDEMFEDGE